mgnify:CR=1 FL=1
MIYVSLNYFSLSMREGERGRCNLMMNADLLKFFYFIRVIQLEQQWLVVLEEEAVSLPRPRPPPTSRPPNSSINRAQPVSSSLSSSLSALKLSPTFLCAKASMNYWKTANYNMVLRFKHLNLNCDKLTQK